MDLLPYSLVTMSALVIFDCFRVTGFAAIGHLKRWAREPDSIPRKLTQIVRTLAEAEGLDDLALSRVPQISGTRFAAFHYPRQRLRAYCRSERLSRLCQATVASPALPLDMFDATLNGRVVRPPCALAERSGKGGLLILVF